MSKSVEQYVINFTKALKEKTQYEVVIEKLTYYQNHFRVVIIVEKNNRKRYVSTYICYENRRIVEQTTDEIISAMLKEVERKEKQLDVEYSRKVEEFEEMIRQNMLEDREEMEDLYR